MAVNYPVIQNITNSERAVHYQLLWVYLGVFGCIRVYLFGCIWMYLGLFIWVFWVYVGVFGCIWAVNYPVIQDLTNCKNPSNVG